MTGRESLMNAAYVPPYPPRPSGALSTLRMVREASRNLLAVWPDRAFEWKLFSYKVLRRQIVVCNSPDSVQHAFIEHAANYHPKSIEQKRALAPLLGDGLFISEGKLWKERRRVVAPVTHASRMAALSVVMSEAAQEQREAWAALPDGGHVDALEAMAALTAKIICLALFGRDLGARNAQTVVEAFTEYQASIETISLLSMLGFGQLLPNLRWLRARRATARIHAVVDRLIADIMQGGSGGEASLIRAMAEGVDTTTGEGMGPVAFRNEAATLFMAGHETTANTLAWAWFLLSQAPEVEARLHAELDAVLPADRPAQWGDLRNLPYTKAVIEETMRLYPPVPLQARTAVAADQIGTRPVAAGATVMVVPWLLHRHRRLWDRPDHFLPERWLPGGGAPPSKYAYVPFSIGPRICPGLSFGLTEAILCLATLARHARLRLQPGVDVQPVCRLTLRPGDSLPMQIFRR
ncbi:cytochrome P450 [Teichococcus deserti]|nr:cytochrome P450 [Pseudoroseomonas deserti]